MQRIPSNAARAPLVLDAPAKLNLGLHVLRKRADGYHDLETVFLRIPWVDVLTVAPSDDLHLTCSDPALPTDGRNLVMKAAQALAAAYGVRRGAALHLEKRIPYGAGLGGGSSDAAAALRLLAAFWVLRVPPARLHALAASLGSDVPFFLGPSAAFATGRGEVLRPLSCAGVAEEYALPYHLVVVVPPVAVATAAAYRLVRPGDSGRPDLEALVCSGDLARWRGDLVNDFEAPVFAAYPAVAEVKRALLAAGAGYAALSGSGSAVFGVFEDGGEAAGAAEAARLSGHRVWQG